MAAIILSALVALQSCKKSTSGNSAPELVATVGTGVGTGAGGSIVAGTDPAVGATQGFFLNNWTAKTFTVPGNTQTAPKPSPGIVKVTADLSQITSKVSKLIFGNNTNPYNGQYVTEPVLMNNLTALSPNILRAPGGSISDIYFWNADGAVITAPADRAG